MKRFRSVLQALLVLWLPSAAFGYVADYTIDFQLGAPHAPNAEIRYRGGSSGLTGTGIGVQSVFGVDPATPVYRILDGTLSFTTGANTFYGYETRDGRLYQSWSFAGGAGSVLNLTGGIADSSGNILVPRGTLLFHSENVPAEIDSFTGRLRVLTMNVTGSEGGPLLELLQQPGVTYEGYLNLALYPLSINPDFSFSWKNSPQIGGGDLMNAPIRETVPVPVPGALFLFGPGFLGMICLKRCLERTAPGQSA